MDAIGSYNFIAVRGAIDVPGRRLADVTESGEDGAVYELESYKAMESELRCIANHSAVSAAKSALAAYKALIGTVTTVSQLGSATANVLIVDVQPDPGGLQQVVNARGGLGSGHNVLQRTIWRVRVCRPN